jgi:hypothetical protein
MQARRLLLDVEHIQRSDAEIIDVSLSAGHGVMLRPSLVVAWLSGLASDQKGHSTPQWITNATGE